MLVNWIAEGLASQDEEAGHKIQSGYLGLDMASMYFLRGSSKSKCFLQAAGVRVYCHSKRTRESLGELHGNEICPPDGVQFPSIRRTYNVLLMLLCKGQHKRVLGKIRRLSPVPYIWGWSTLATRKLPPWTLAICFQALLSVTSVKLHVRARDSTC